MDGIAARELRSSERRPRDDTEEALAPTEEPQESHGRPFIPYEYLVWFVFATWALLAVLDRFTWNVWPRDGFRIGRGGAGTDIVGAHYFELRPGPWSVKLYDAVARVSGRYSIVALNLLFFTMCHTTYAFLSETWLARHVVDMSDYVLANRRIHRANGAAIVATTLVHVWSILFPTIFEGWRARVVPGAFEWPLSERKPAGFGGVDLARRTVSMQADDAFRIVEMTVLLGALLPLTLRWFRTKWHFGVQLHSLIAVLYFVDIVRRHTHPHSWVLNAPFFAFWVLDCAAGKLWRRHCAQVHRLRLSDDYMLVFWKQRPRSSTVGPKYYLKLRDSALLERAHVFTGFENRCGLRLCGGLDWTACLLVRIYSRRRALPLGRRDRISHTGRIAESSDLDLVTWGPFQSDMSDAVRASIADMRVPVTLVAGGSAAGYLIDAVQQYRNAESLSGLTVLYSSRDAALTNWVAETLTALMKHMSPYNCHVVLAITSEGRPDKTLKDIVKRPRASAASDSSSTESDRSYGRSDTSAGGKRRQDHSVVQVRHGRINFAKEIPARSIVFFQGSSGIRRAVEHASLERDCRFVAGPSYDNDEKRRKPFLRKLGLRKMDV